jgi:hypothetical protein
LRKASSIARSERFSTRAFQDSAGIHSSRRPGNFERFGSWSVGDFDCLEDAGVIERGGSAIKDNFAQ